MRSRRRPSLTTHDIVASDGPSPHAPAPTRTTPLSSTSRDARRAPVGENTKTCTPAELHLASVLLGAAADVLTDEGALATLKPDDVRAQCSRAQQLHAIRDAERPSASDAHPRINGASR